jgi:Schlafen, AlbA_2
MTAIGIFTLTPPETTKLLTLEEGHFADVKAIEVTPAKLTRSLSAFANAEGGELFVGIDEHKQRQKRTWRGFNRVEDANGFLQVFEQLFPLGEEYTYNFLQSPSGSGYVLKAEIRKSRDVTVGSCSARGDDRITHRSSRRSHSGLWASRAASLHLENTTHDDGSSVPTNASGQLNIELCQIEGADCPQLLRQCRIVA